MHSTRNELPKTTRAKVIDLLDARLADAADLQTQLKQAHGNVKGPTFIALHELFDKINEAVEDYVDRPGRARRAAWRHRARDGAPDRQALDSAGVPGGECRAGSRRAGGGGAGRLREAGARWHRPGRRTQGKDTADLFTEISRGVDKWLWFVEAHLQAHR